MRPYPSRKLLTGPAPPRRSVCALAAMSFRCNADHVPARVGHFDLRRRKVRPETNRFLALKIEAGDTCTPENRSQATDPRFWRFFPTQRQRMISHSGVACVLCGGPHWPIQCRPLNPRDTPHVNSLLARHPQIPSSPIAQPATAKSFCPAREELLHAASSARNTRRPPRARAGRPRKL